MHFARTTRVSNIARCAAFLTGILIVLSTAFAGQVTYETDPATGRLMKATFANGSYMTYSYDGNGNRESAVLTVVQDPPPSAPGTPSFSSITETSATASWGPASDNVGVTGYQYSLNGGSWTAGSSPLSLSGLSPATTYSFQVRAGDAAGNWGSPSGNSFATLDSTAPSSPGTPSFSSIAASSATASWSAASDNVAVTGYRYRLNGGAWVAISASPASLTGLLQASAYTFEVSARDAAGNWGSASAASFTTLDASAPSAPGTPSFSSITHNSVTASWSAANDNVGVTGYQYRLNSGSWIANSSTSVNLTGLSAGTSYSFEVRAGDAANNFGNASSGSFTTNVQITISNRTIHTQVPGSATAVYVITNAGDILTSGATSNTNSDTGDWLTPKSGMSNYQARATPVSGTCGGGTMNTWITLSGSPAWAKGIGGPVAQTVSCSFTLEIRHSANPALILGTAHIALSARNQ
jgi:chitodextrinase